MGFNSTTENVAETGHFVNVAVEDARVSEGRAVGKRAMDIAIAICGLTFTSPLILIIAILVKLQDDGPAFFSQDRYGLGGKTFKCFKLRSMVSDAQERLDELLANDPAAQEEWEKTQKLRNDPRITPLGHFIRKTSIDELPQLFNVLKGEMSIVGPRPIIQSEIAKYGAHYEDYCSVRPGITGLWQVEGRSNTTYEERVQLDAKYARTNTLFGDVMIVLKTIPAVLFSRGAV